MAYEPCSACGSDKGPEHLCPGLAEQYLGRVLDGRYQVQGVIGQGGMGMVFEAMQTSVMRPVAVKTLHPALASAPQFFDRFRREAEMASRLRHPNIITIYDFGRTRDGTCYYVMELLEGESLKQLVKRGGPLSLRAAVEIIDQAARGLAHAHHQNVIHRDIKPHNIMVQSLDGKDFVKVLDFGLVKALEQEDAENQLTSTGQVLGTPQYMPPEQAGGEPVDQRSDLYSLTGVFYYCLTGTSPFGANTVRKALTAALTQAVPPVATHRPGAPVPRAVDELIRRGLAREKEDRYQNAEELIADLRASVEGVEDAILDALPGAQEKPKPDREAGSHSGTNARTNQHQARQAGGKQSGSNAMISASSEFHRRTTAGEVPSLKRSAESVTQARPKLRLALWVTPLLLAAAGGGVIWKLRSSPPIQQPPLRLVPDPPPLPAPPSTSEVKVRLLSVPPGASILEESGVVIGRTPLELRWAKDELHTLRFQLAGHAEVTRQFRLARDETLEIQLEPLRSTAGKSPKRKGEEIPVFE